MSVARAKGGIKVKQKSVKLLVCTLGIVLAPVLAQLLAPVLAQAPALDAQTRALLGQAQALAQQARQQNVARSPDATLWASAIASAEQATRKAPAAPEVWQVLATLYTETRWWAKAEEVWTEYFKRAGPNNPQALQQAATVQFNLGYAAYQQGDYSRALARFESAAEYNPSDPQAQRWLGRIYLEQGNPSAAREHWQQALNLKPDDTNRYFLSISQDMARYGTEAVRSFLSGYEAYSDGEKQAALEAFGSATQKARGWLEAQRWVGRIQLELGQTDQALSTWQNIAASPQATRSDRYQLRSAELSAQYGVEAARAFLQGVALYESKDHQAAKEQFELATQATSGFATAWYWLGRIAFESQDYTAAEQAYAEVLALEPGNKEAQYWLAQSRKALGE